MADGYDDSFDDFDDIDDMDGMEGFGDADNDEPVEDRNPVSSTFKGASASFVDDFKDTSAIKQVGDVADSAFQAAAGKKVSKNYNALKNTLNKEIGKSTRDIKEAAKPFVNKLKDVVPEEGILRDILTKVDGIVGSTTDRGEESEEARIQRESNELTVSLFGESAKKEVLNQAIASMANKQRDELLQHIAAVNSTTLEFHNSNTLGYYKKSIELKYKHLFETKRMFALQAKSFETFKRQFETIVKNTGLPEFVKIRGLESAKNQLRQRAYGTAYESIMNNNSWIENAKTNITNRFRSTTQGITDGLAAGSEGLDMATDLGDQLSDEDQRNMILGSMAADGTRTLSGRIMGKLFGKTKRGKKFRKWIEKVNYDPGTYFGNLAEKHTGLKGKAAGTVANLVSLDDNYAPYKDMLKENLDSATFFDIRTRKSITTVIPGLLSKIYASVEGMRTGNEPDGLTYDYNKDSFITNSSVKETLISELGDTVSKAHKQTIESFVKALVIAADIKLSKKELYKLGARLTSFGIRDKNITIGTLEAKGFFKNLDPRTEMMYRSIFDNLGKDENGEVDYNIVDGVNREMGRALNIRSNPEKIIQKMIDDGNTEQLVELGILKWDRKKQSYIIDLAKFDQYSIKGINKYLFKDEPEFKTNDDNIRDRTKQAVIKTKKDILDKIAKHVNKVVDPLMEQIVSMEQAYDDPQAKSRLRTARDMLVRGKEEAFKGKDIKSAKKQLDRLVKDVKNLTKEDLKDVNKNNYKTKAKAVWDKINIKAFGRGIKDDASNIASRAKAGLNAANDTLDNDFDINVKDIFNKQIIRLMNGMEKQVIERYELDPKADKETIKAMRNIVFDNFSTLDMEDVKRLSKSGIKDIFQNIIDDIEDAGLHLKGGNKEKLKEDARKAKDKSKDKVSNTLKKHMDKLPDWLRMSPEKKEEWKDTLEDILDKETPLKDKPGKYFGKGKKFFTKGKGSWKESLNDTLTSLKDSITKPKFGIFDKDKDGDRDGGYLDRLDFFNKSRKTTKKESKDEKKKSGGGILGLLTGALGVGGTLFAGALKGIAGALLGLPAALSNIGGVLGAVKDISTLGIKTLGWGFSGMMGLLRLTAGGAGLLGKGWKGLGRADKWLGPKLRSIAKFPFTNPKKTLAGLALASFSPELATGAKNMWDGLFENKSYDNTQPPDIDIDTTGSSFANNGDFLPSEGKNTLTGIAAGVGAYAAGKHLYNKKNGNAVKEGAGSAVKKGVGRTLLRTMGKAIPFAGAAIYGNEAYERFGNGNYLGAAASTAAAGLSFVPGLGWVAGMGLSYLTAEDEQPKEKNSKPETPDLHRVHKLLLDRIAKGEIKTTSSEGYNISLGFGKYMPKDAKPLTSMTIAEVYAVQHHMITQGARSNAVGRYQLIHITLKDLVDSLNIDIQTTKFTPELQDALILRRLFSTRKYGSWLKGGISDETFIYHLSKEFASIACSINTGYKGRSIRKGQSFYGQGVHTTLKDMQDTLGRMRKMLGNISLDTSTEVKSNKPKQSSIVHSILGGIEMLLTSLGIKVNHEKVTPQNEYDDGTAVYSGSKNSYYSGEVSPVRGNKIKGTFDIDKQLGGIPYKHISIPKAAGPEIVPEYLVMHNTDGSSLYLGGMYKNPAIGTAVWIDTNGDIIIINKLTNRTWHVGKEANLLGDKKCRSSNSIGIEMVCKYNTKTHKWNRYTKAQIASLRKVGAYIIAKFNIPMDKVKAHFEVAKKTPGEGAEGVAILNGVGLAPEISSPSNSSIVINEDIVKTLPITERPAESELGDNTPTYPGMDKSAREQLLKKQNKRFKETDEWIDKNSTPMDMKKMLKDVDMSIGKPLSISLEKLNRSIENSNKYNEQIAINTGQGGKVDITLKDEKGDVVPHVIQVPEKMVFNRAVLK